MEGRGRAVPERTRAGRTISARRPSGVARQVVDRRAAKGSIYVIEPDNNAWVVGDEPFVGFEFDAPTAEEFAKA